MSGGRASGALRAALRLLYPTRAVCMGCGTLSGFERDWLCEKCRQQLAQRWVGAFHPPSEGLFDGAAFAYYYGGPAGGLVRNLKYRGVYQLAEMMGRHMAEAFEALGHVRVDGVVPVPMHPRRVRMRGYNHAELLAGEVAGRLNLPLLKALSRSRNTRQQARLSDAQRQGNLNRAFELRMEVAGKRLLLVDDVCTTWTTANACAKVLSEGGASELELLCFAVSRSGN